MGRKYAYFTDGRSWCRRALSPLLSARADLWGRSRELSRQRRVQPPLLVSRRALLGGSGSRRRGDGASNAEEQSRAAAFDGAASCAASRSRYRDYVVERDDAVRDDT